MWKQRAFLRHVTDASLLWRKIDSPRGGVECSAIDGNLAVDDASQAGNGVEQSRLARTGRPKDSSDPRIEGRVDVEIEVCQRYAAAQFHLKPFFPSAAATPSTRRTG